jgi:hypothetical protein
MSIAPTTLAWDFGFLPIPRRLQYFPDATERPKFGWFMNLTFGLAAAFTGQRISGSSTTVMLVLRQYMNSGQHILLSALAQYVLLYCVLRHLTI